MIGRGLHARQNEIQQFFIDAVITRLYPHLLVVVQKILYSSISKHEVFNYPQLRCRIARHGLAEAVRLMGI